MNATLTFPLRAAFLAVPIEGEAKIIFQELQKRLISYSEILSFQNPKSPHLTLQYWPSLMSIEYDQVLLQSEKITMATLPFSLKIEGIDTFGRRRENRVLFCDIPFSEPLARLKNLCPLPCVDRGEKEVPNAPFHPHLTLAHIRHPQEFTIAKKKILKLLGSPSFHADVSMICLYGEMDGRKQTQLADFPFLKKG